AVAKDGSVGRVDLRCVGKTRIDVVDGDGADGEIARRGEDIAEDIRTKRDRGRGATRRQHEKLAPPQPTLNLTIRISVPVRCRFHRSLFLQLCSRDLRGSTCYATFARAQRTIEIRHKLLKALCLFRTCRDKSRKRACFGRWTGVRKRDATCKCLIMNSLGSAGAANSRRLIARRTRTAPPGRRLPGDVRSGADRTRRERRI